MSCNKEDKVKITKVEHGVVEIFENGNRIMNTYMLDGQVLKINKRGTMKFKAQTGKIRYRRQEKTEIEI